MNAICIIKIYYTSKYGSKLCYTAGTYFKTLEAAKKAAPKIWENCKEEGEELEEITYDILLPYDE